MISSILCLCGFALAGLLFDDLFILMGGGHLSASASNHRAIVWATAFVLIAQRFVL